MNISATYYENKSYMWCVIDEDAFLYRIDRASGKMEEVVPLISDIYMKNAYSDILCYKDSFILVPCNAEVIAIVDRNDWTRQHISLSLTEYHIGKSMFKFFTGIVHQDNLFLFGYTYPGIVKVNLISKEVEVIDNWLKRQIICFNDENDGCFHVQYCRLENKVYFPFMNSNAVLQFDLQTEEIVIHKVGDNNQRYISIEWDGAYFWLVPRDGSQGSIIKWDPVSGATEYFSNFPAGFDYHKYAFYRTEIIKNKLLLFAHCGNSNISIDLKTGQMETFAHLYCTENVRGCKYSLVWKHDNIISVLRNTEWITWDYSRNIIENFVYELDEKIVRRYRDKEIKEKFEKSDQEKIYKEDNKYCNLESFLSYIVLSS